MVDHWTVQRLALLAGHGPARAMLLAAEVLSGDDAVRLGLAQRAGDLDDALAWAEEIAALAPLTIQGHKVALNRLEADLGHDPAVGAAFAKGMGQRGPPRRASRHFTNDGHPLFGASDVDVDLEGVTSSVRTEPVSSRNWCRALRRRRSVRPASTTRRSA